MKRLTLGLLLAAAAPAAAQTARIAHASHSGSPETLAADAAADNFGIVGPYFVADSVRLLTDTTALEYGKWQGYRVGKAKASDKSQTIQFSPRRTDGNYRAARVSYLQGLQNSYHPVKLIGDTLPAANKASKPQLIKAKTKRPRKQAALAPLPAAPSGPTLHGGLLLAAGILLLTAAGWVLTTAPDKRPLAPAA